MAHEMILRRKVEWYIRFLGDDPRKTAHALLELDKMSISRNWIIRFKLIEILGGLRKCPRNGWMAQRMICKYSAILSGNSDFIPNAEAVRFRFSQSRSECSSAYSLSNTSSFTSSASNSPLGLDSPSNGNGEDTGFGGSVDSVNKTTCYVETDSLLMDERPTSFYETDYQSDADETYRLLAPCEVKTKLRKLERIREIV